MRYVRFKRQTVRNAKCSYHCSGPLESYLYTQMRPVLANFLILMFLSQIYIKDNKKKKKKKEEKNELEETTYSSSVINDIILR